MLGASPLLLCTGARALRRHHVVACHQWLASLSARPRPYPPARAHPRALPGAINSSPRRLLTPHHLFSLLLELGTVVPSPLVVVVLYLLEPGGSKLRTSQGRSHISHATTPLCRSLRTHPPPPLTPIVADRPIHHAACGTTSGSPVMLSALSPKPLASSSSHPSPNRAAAQLRKTVSTAVSLGPPQHVAHLFRRCISSP